MTNDRATELVRRASPALKKAVDYDKLDKINDAIAKYTEGITTLSVALRLMSKDHKKYDEVVKVLPEYEKRVEELKKKCHFEVTWSVRLIEENSTGHGYDKIFGPCCDEKLRNVEVHDSYIRYDHQVTNFIRFCELVVLMAKKLKTITLRTHVEAKKNEAVFEKLGESLEKQEISLHFEFSTTIHDREIKFDNGWTVKIGRGLDYFQPVDPNGIGAFEMNLRPCKETKIDILREKK